MPKSLFLLAAVFTSVALLGCGKDDGTSGNLPRVALILRPLSSEPAKAMDAAAKAHQKQNPLVYELLSMPSPDAKAQSDLVDKAIAQKVHAIVIDPSDAKSLVPACKKARDAGIVVVNIAHQLDAGALSASGTKIGFIGPDNQRGAYMAGRFIATKLSSGDQVIVLEGPAGDPVSDQRKAGYDQVINEKGFAPLPPQSANGQAADAEKIAAPLVKSQPKLRAIFCFDDATAEGVIKGISDVEQKDPLYISGYGNTPAGRKLVKEQKIVCTVDSHWDQIAVNGIRAALDAIQTKSPTVADHLTPVDLVTKDDLEAR